MSEGPLSTSAEHPIFAVKFTEPIEVGSDGRECKIYAKDETPTKYTKSFSDRKNYVVLDDGDLVYRAGESSSFNGTSRFGRSDKTEFAEFLIPSLSYSLVSYDPETNEWEFKQMCYARIGTRIRSSSTLDELGEKMVCTHST